MIFQKERSVFFLLCQALLFSSRNFVGIDHRESSSLKHEPPLSDGHRGFEMMDLGKLKYGYQ